MYMSYKQAEELLNQFTTSLGLNTKPLLQDGNGLIFDDGIQTTFEYVAESLWVKSPIKVSAEEALLINANVLKTSGAFICKIEGDTVLTTKLTIDSFELELEHFVDLTEGLKQRYETYSSISS